MRLGVIAGNHRRRVPAPPTGLAPTQQPQISGIPREGESASMWAGVWPAGVNKFRYRVYRDSGTGPALIRDVAQVSDEYHFDFVSADAYKLCTATVEASSDNGATWSAPVEPYYAFYPDTQLIEPAFIAPDFAIARTSAAGAALTFDISGTLLPSLLLHIRVYDQDYVTLKYEGFKALTEEECLPGATIKLDGSTGPSPDPAMPVPLQTDIVVGRPVTQDWLENMNPGDNAGKAGPWGGASATDFGGNRYWMLKVNSAVWGTDGGCVMQEIELAETIGGPNIARRKNYIFSPGHYSPDTQGGDTFQSSHLFDGSPTTIGALSNAVPLPGYIIVDMLIPRPIGELRIGGQHDHALQAPGDIAFGSALPNATFIGTPPVAASGLTWSNAADETKSFPVTPPAAGGNFILRADGASKILRADGASFILRAA